MTDRNQHIDFLTKSDNWTDYLIKNSGLPGKRSNLELLDVVAELGDETFFKTCLTFDENTAPTNTPGEFVATCGVTGLGKLINEGNDSYFELLKTYASDPRWRVREGVAFALQIVGKNDFDKLFNEVKKWKTGNPFEKRALVAGLCEPVLLKEKENAIRVLELVGAVVESVEEISDRKSESFRVLRKGLGYGLSVAMAACPEEGKAIFEKLKQKPDKDIRWILNENLKKKRLERMDSEWTNRMKKALFALCILLLQLAGYSQTEKNRILITEDIELIRLSEHAYIHVSYVNVNGYGRVGANGLVLINGKQAFLFDTPWTEQQTEELLTGLKKIMGVKVLGFVPNHWHEDCMGGLGYLQKQGIKSYANQLTIDIAKTQGLPQPETGFTDSLELQLGDLPISCYYLGAAHSKDNVVVWIPSEQILFPGCMVKELNSANLGNTADGDLRAYPETLAKLKNKFPTAKMIIPGHGAYGGTELIEHTLGLARN